MSAEAEVKEQPPAPAKRGWLNTVLLILVGVAAAAAGSAAPFLLSASKDNTEKSSDSEAKRAADAKPAFVAFGDVAVNLAEERLTRYIRVKVILVVETVHEKQVNEIVTKNKAILKNWLISYLSDKSMKDVTGAVGVNRARREIQDQFNSILFPDGSEKIRDVLFEEFLVQ